MQKIIEWIKTNPWKAAVIGLSIAAVLTGAFGFGCGYVKGCSAQKEKQEAAQ
jgi:hypothetical protein